LKQTGLDEETAKFPQSLSLFAIFRDGDWSGISPTHAGETCGEKGQATEDNLMIALFIQTG